MDLSSQSSSPVSYWHTFSSHYNEFVAQMMSILHQLSSLFNNWFSIFYVYSTCYFHASISHLIDNLVGKLTNLCITQTLIWYALHWYCIWPFPLLFMTDHKYQNVCGCSTMMMGDSFNKWCHFYSGVFQATWYIFVLCDWLSVIPVVSNTMSSQSVLSVSFSLLSSLIFQLKEIMSLSLCCLRSTLQSKCHWHFSILHN